MVLNWPWRGNRQWADGTVWNDTYRGMVSREKGQERSTELYSISEVSSYLGLPAYVINQKPCMRCCIFLVEIRF